MTEFLNQSARALPLEEVKGWTAGTRPQQRCSASLLLTCLRLCSGREGVGEPAEFLLL